MAVGQREDRLGLRQQLEVELALGDAPRLDREHVRADHDRSLSAARTRSLDHDVRAVLAQRLRRGPVRSTPTTSRSGRPGRPRRRPARPRTRQPGPARRRPPGRRPGTCRARASRPGARARRRCRRSAPRTDRSMPAATSTSWQFVLEDTTAARSPRCARARRSDRSLVRLNALVVDQLQSPGRSCAGRGRRSSRPRGDRPATPSGRSMARDCRNDCTPSRTRLAVDVPLVVVGKHELAKRLAGRARASSRRNSSNICFHALAWTFAVWVSTPSRSNRQVVMPSGRSSTPGSFRKGRAFEASGVRILAMQLQGRGGWPGGARSRRSRCPPRRRRRTGSRGRAASSSSACSPALWATRKSGPSFSRRSPTEVLSSITTSHSPGKPASTSLSSPSTDAASAVASSRRRSALGVAAAGLRLLLLRPRSTSSAVGRSARPAGRRCTSSRGPCGRRARERARSSPARAPRRRRRARCRTRAARPTPRGRRASRTSSGRPSWSGSSCSR